MTFAFLVLAAAAAASSVMVVVSRRVVRSALFLIVSFLAVAGVFLLLGAEFLAAVQILVYAGSVVVLFVFTVMTVGQGEARGRRGPFWWAGGAALLLSVIGELLAAMRPLISGALGAGPPASEQVTREMGRLVFSGWLLPLEAFSLLILAVMLGIAALRRELRRPS